MYIICNLLKYYIISRKYYRIIVSKLKLLLKLTRKSSELGFYQGRLHSIFDSLRTILLG